MADEPPRKHALLFDGRCNFCRRQLERLLSIARPGGIEPVDFQAPGALDRFPGLTYEACMQAMHLVTPQGQVYRGFEAAVHAVATRPIVGKLAYFYYVPGIRQICDRFYAWIAARRYRLAGECPSGTCSLHLPARQKPVRDVQNTEDGKLTQATPKEKIP